MMFGNSNAAVFRDEWKAKAPDFNTEQAIRRLRQYISVVSGDTDGFDKACDLLFGKNFADAGAVGGSSYSANGTDVAEPGGGAFAMSLIKNPPRTSAAIRHATQELRQRGMISDLAEREQDARLKAMKIVEAQNFVRFSALNPAGTFPKPAKKLSSTEANAVADRILRKKK